MLSRREWLALAPAALLQAAPRGLEEIYIRDPFVLADAASKTYYMYGQMGRRASGVEAFASQDLKTWSDPVKVMEVPAEWWARDMVWAPEVHRYRDRYYLFVTLTRRASPADIRGTQIFHADSPLGPFKPFRNAPTTPADWQALDGTLWMEDGKPYMVFCHEWVQLVTGTIDAMPLKDDLSEAAGPPVPLFRATDAKWIRHFKQKREPTQGYVTDGPFLFRTPSGRLRMIWSSFAERGYALAVATSESGKLRGPWRQNEQPLFTTDGGHGMIFRDFDGRLLLALHQPNGGGRERARLFELDPELNSYRDR